MHKINTCRYVRRGLSGKDDQHDEEKPEQVREKWRHLLEIMEH